MIHLDEQVSGKDIERFLATRGVAEACPLCGCDEMSISVFDPESAKQDQAPAVRVIHTMDDGSRRGYGEFLRVCTNCGYIQYIRDIEVLAFIEGEGDNG